MSKGLIEPHLLTYLRNLALNRCNILVLWKHVIIIIIPKYGKPGDVGNSYLPISLFYLVVKVLVCLLHPEKLNSGTYTHVTPNNSLIPFQESNPMY